MASLVIIKTVIRRTCATLKKNQAGSGSLPGKFIEFWYQSPELRPSRRDWWACRRSSWHIRRGSSRHIRRGSSRHIRRGSPWYIRWGSDRDVSGRSNWCISRGSNRDVSGSPNWHTRRRSNRHTGRWSVVFLIHFNFILIIAALGHQL